MPRPCRRQVLTCGRVLQHVLYDFSEREHQDQGVVLSEHVRCDPEGGGPCGQSVAAIGGHIEIVLRTARQQLLQCLSRSKVSPGGGNSEETRDRYHQGGDSTVKNIVEPCCPSGIVKPISLAPLQSRLLDRFGIDFLIPDPSRSTGLLPGGLWERCFDREDIVLRPCVLFRSELQGLVQGVPCTVGVALLRKLARRCEPFLHRRFLRLSPQLRKPCSGDWADSALHEFCLYIGDVSVLAEQFTPLGLVGMPSLRCGRRRHEVLQIRNGSRLGGHARQQIGSLGADWPNIPKSKSDGLQSTQVINVGDIRRRYRGTRKRLNSPDRLRALAPFLRHSCDSRNLARLFTDAFRV